MSRKLTQDEINLLETFRQNKDLAGAGLLRQYIILNSYEPKYKVGDTVLVTCDCGEYIWGKRIDHVHARITEINYCLREKGKEFIQYDCVAYDQDGNDYFICVEESIHGYYEKRHIDGPSKTDKNVFDKTKSKHSQSCSVEGSPL